MRILLVAATRLEIEPLLDRIAASRHTIEVLETGVGMVPTAVRCTAALATAPWDLALNAGVCGSFDPALPPGTAVHVVSDRIAELGVEDGNAFVPAEQLGLVDPDRFPLTGGVLVNARPPQNS